MTIYDGRKSFYQWDLNQRLVDNFKVGDEVHFYNYRQPTALVVLAYELDGKTVVDVPNALLQTACPITACRYVYDGTSAHTKEECTFAVEQRAKPSDYVYNETELYTITTAVNKALEDAKNSGEFKGEQGERGEKGDKGDTPVKGVDYYTDDEKHEFANKVALEASTLYANAIKATASGEIVHMDDVSLINHIVKVKVHGKNLLSFDYPIDIKSTYHSWSVNPNHKTVTMSITDKDTSVDISGMYLGLCGNGINGDDGVIWLVKNGEIQTRTFTTNKYVYVSIYRDYSKDVVATALSSRFNIQVEENHTATEYEPYINPSTVTVTKYGVDENDNYQTYTPNADGTVGIVSLYPTMTLLTDTSGVTIEAEYNRDAAVVIDNLQTQVNELRAMINELKG